jgi:ABC-type bacteriocin/lantibiotic exporter with double-glycine peptidase domain
MIVLMAFAFGLVSHQPGPADQTNLRCGAYCLYVGLGALDVSTGLFDEFESALGQPGKHGYSMEDLAAAAQRAGAHTQGVETSLENLSYRKGRFACIAPLERAHFVNVYDVDLDARRVYIIDPPNKREMDADAFNAVWSKKALLISNQPLEPEV